MEVHAAFIADAESFELVEPGEGALDDPAGLAEAGAVGDAASGDEGLDAALPQQSVVLVVAAVGEQALGLAARTSPHSPYAGDCVQKRDQLRDVMPVPAGHGHGQRGSEAVDDQVVLGAGAGSVDRRRPDTIPLTAVLREGQSAC